MFPLINVHYARTRSFLASRATRRSRMRRMQHRKWASSVSRGSLADILDSSSRTIRDAVAAVRVAVVEGCGTCLERPTDV